MKPTAGSRVRTVALVVTIVGLLAVAFIVLDFRMAHSETTTSVQASAASSGEKAQGLVSGQRVLLYVEKQGPFSESLLEQIQDSLRSSSLFGPIEVIESYDEQMPDAVIVVTTKDLAQFYTPVYATTDLQAQIYYSSNGDLSFIRTGTSDMRSSEDEAMKRIIQTKQVIDLTDRTIGITSYPAYYDYLAGKTTEAIVDYLEKTLSTT